MSQELLVAKRSSLTEEEENQLLEETFDEADLETKVEASVNKEEAQVEEKLTAESISEKKPAVKTLRDHPDVKRRTLLIPPRPNRVTAFKRPSTSAIGERGRLLKLSTKKPKIVAPPSTPQIDLEPPNSVTNIKRVARLAKQPTIEAVSTTRDFGTQFGVPLGEFLKRRKQSVAKPTGEPPLQGFWTHKINLPYPPQQQQVHQQQVQQQHPQQLVQFAQQPQFMQTTGGSLVQVGQQPQFVQTANGNFVQIIPPNCAPQKNYQSIGQANRHKRRNYIKRQKYQQRKASKESQN